MYYIQSEVKVAQSCLTLCDPMDFTVHGILQARILEWIAFPLSRGSTQPRDWTHVSPLQVDSLTAEPQGSPRILEWVACPFSSGYSQARNRSRVSSQQCRQILCTIYKLGFNFLNIKLIIAHPTLWKYKLIDNTPNILSMFFFFFFNCWNNCQSSG